MFVTSLRGSLSLGVCLCVTLFSSLAAADPSAADKESARTAWTAGMASRKEGRHADALKGFEAAHALMGLPTTGIEVAREREALGLLVEALATARAVSGMATKTAEDRHALAAASALVARVQPKLGIIEVAVQGPAAGTPLRIRVDGVDLPADLQALPIPANPGAHTLMIGAQGYRPVVRSMDVAEGASVRVAVELHELPPPVPEAPPPPPSPPSPPGPPERWAWGPNARPAGVLVHIDSDDPEVGLYRAFYQEGTGATMPGRWNGNTYTPGMTFPGSIVKQRVCLAPCDAFADGSYGDGFFLGIGRSQLGESFTLGSYGELNLRARVTRQPSFFQRATGLTLLVLGASTFVLGGFIVGISSLETSALSLPALSMMLGGGAGVGLGIGLYLHGLGNYRVDVPAPQTGSPTMLRINGVF